MKIFSFVLLVFIIVSCNKESETQIPKKTYVELDLSETRDTAKNYYYYDDSDTIIPLQIDYSCLFIILKESRINKPLFLEFFNNYSQIIFDTTNIIVDNNSIKINLVDSLSAAEYYGLLKSLNEYDYYEYVSPIFKFGNVARGMYSNISVKPVNDYESFNNDLLDRYNNIEITATLSSGNRHIRITDVKTGFEAMDIANELHTQDNIFWAYPGFEMHFVMFK